MLVFAIVMLIIFGAVNTVVLTAMKMEVNRRVPAEEQISWWVHDTKNEIGRKYGVLFPDSALPSTARFTGWICILLFAALISTVLFDK